MDYQEYQAEELLIDALSQYLQILKIELLTAMGELFVRDKIIDPYILSTDSTLVKAKGFVWHKSSIEEGVVPRSGIDTNARWGFSHTKGWIFGYNKLHLISTCTGSIIVPLSVDFTTANIPDNQIYSILVASLPATIIRRTSYMSADPGYDDHALYDLSTDMGFQLVCPIQRYKNTPADRMKLIKFYKSKVGQTVYSLRSTSIEPLIGHIKSAFRIDPLPVCGYVKSCAIVSTTIGFAISDTSIL